jgi:NDP-sugar pyrophosphorylase family protein
MRGFGPCRIAGTRLRNGSIVSNPLTAVVLAGGQGTRLRPLTDRLPKPVLPVLNRPFLDYLIERLKNAGVTKVIFAIGYQPEPLVERYGRGKGFGVEIDYAVEDSPLGTSGAVRAILPQLTETFLVLNGDVVTSVDLRPMIDDHIERREFATIAIHEEADPSRYGVVPIDGEGYVLRFVEKPKGPLFPAKTVNSGVYVLEPEALRFVADGQPSMFERDLFPNMLRMNMQVHSFRWDGYFLDMGTPESYLALNRDFLTGAAPEWHKPNNGPSLGNNVSIAANAKVTGPVALGDDVSLEGSAVVTGPAVLGPGCIVEDGATVQGSVLWDGVRVGHGAQLIGTVIGSQVSIAPGATHGAGTIIASAG